MAQPPTGMFSSMVSQLKENSQFQQQSPQQGNKKLNLPPGMPPGHHQPQLDISTVPLGNSPNIIPHATSGTTPIANGNGTHEHPNLIKSESFSTPPRAKLTMSGNYPKGRIHGISVSPGTGEYSPGPLSPPSLGVSPGGLNLMRSGSREEFSPRDKFGLGISPRTTLTKNSSPIPIITPHIPNSPLSTPPHHSPSFRNIPPTDGIQMVAKDGTSKANWTADVIKKHPEILQIMDRVRPIGRAASFGKTYTVQKTPTKEEFLVGKDHMLQLILQHLHYEGLKGARKTLEEEAGVKYVDPQLSESRLLNLIRMAVKDTEKVWELTLSTSAEAGHLLEELLSDLSLLQEDPALEADDINIWDETEEGNILFADEKDANATGDGAGMISPPQSPNAYEKTKQVKAASLNRLIVLLAPEEKHDIEYLKTFLLTYQSFTTPQKLLQKLIQRYHVPQKPGMSDEDYKRMCVVIQLRVTNAIKAWIVNHWSDFNDKLLASLKAFIDGTLRIENKNLAEILVTQLNAKKPEEEEAKKAKKFNEDPPEPKVPKNIFSLYLNLFDVDEEEIARQITLIDFEIYSSIKLSELLNQSWNKPKLRHRSPNVMRMINRFNEISQWVATSILRQEKIRDRSRTMTKFIKIADYLLRTLNNFNTTMAILAGLNGAAVHRLKHTREEMGRNINQLYTDMQTALDSNQSYKGYRNLLLHANPPCIPYLGVYLTDLTFIEDGNPDYIGKLVNFTKRKYIYDVIAKVKQYQYTSYNLQPVYQIACLLEHPVREHMDEDKQFKMSLLREPRNAERSEIV